MGLRHDSLLALPKPLSVVKSGLKDGAPTLGTESEHLLAIQHKKSLDDHLEHRHDGRSGTGTLATVKIDLKQ